MLRTANFAKPLFLLALCFAIVQGFAKHNQAQETVTLTNGKGEELKVKIGDDDAAKDDRVPVDVAILLDTSNSMDGLINQARNQLWQIVQRLSVTEKDGRKPALRVSVFEYGNTNLPATENYIRQVLPLSDDLDKVSEALFGLTTRGGDEYCGAVIGEAIARLDWSSDDDAYKSIFIAGNEAFTQGQISYLSTCADAREKGILVNTIHCGDHSTGVKGKWADGAEKGGGQSFNINQDRQQVTIKCPQDKILLELNTKLNKTYLWFGDKTARHLYCENQLAQDTNAAGGRGMGGMGTPAPAFGSRVASKATTIYDNRSRDLVDAMKADAKSIEEVEEEKLPDAMQTMSKEERKKFVAEKAAERAKVQAEIKKVAKEREAYLAAERKKLGEKKDTFGDAICLAIDKQLAEKGFGKAKR
ncbi:vWA domain-containing protein [Mariniblastus fucicola]|uniref:VWFA domain-containing protein n=1 Tax=Mariniblastus fucicola TaxID=980251 RepID=A0A5B9PE53_9BACT|nr:vWA domain-containing protein [Mariniblastus fucicola]QEG23475.1 hypothetical protein MFFC18_33740 [Mariniblastus fucicola]